MQKLFFVITAMLEFITTMFTLMSNIYRTTPKSKRDNPRVEIRGVESRMWLCMNQSGALYGSVSITILNLNNLY